MRNLIVLLLGSFVLLSGCRKEFVVPDGVREIAFLPAETSPQLAGTEDKPHLAWIANSAVLKNYLLVHLPGTLSETEDARRFPVFAAEKGYHSLSLIYSNRISATSVCRNSTDPACFDNFHQEICLGDAVSGDVDIPAGTDIKSRLIAAVEWLNTQYPGEGWGNYVDNGEPVWDRIILSGHSQGGGHAAYLAHQYEVHRCLMFASPNDYSAHFDAPGAWVSTTSQTPAASYFALGHEDDRIVEFSEQVAHWEAMGLTQNVPTTNIDKENAPFGNAQALSTDIKPRPRTATHSCMIIDRILPLDRDGLSEFRPVWEYMLGN